MKLENIVDGEKLILLCKGRLMAGWCLKILKTEMKSCTLSPAEVIKILFPIPETAMEIQLKEAEERALKRAKDNERKARAWEKSHWYITEDQMKQILEDVNHELLAQSKTPPTAEEGNKDE